MRELMFVRCETGCPHGPELYAWLTVDQVNGYGDMDEPVEVFEDRVGEMIVCMIPLGDVVPIEEI